MIRRIVAKSSIKRVDMAIKIYIDQGHNPQNPNAGAEGNGYREQDITFRVGNELARLLERSGNYDVRVSRSSANTQLGSSNTTSLRARVEGAESFGADYFISIHTNASDNPAATGSEAYAYGRNTRAFELATDVVNNLSEATGLRNRGAKVRPSLYVLKKTSMPAILVELGFITNPRDASLMANNPELFAEGIYNGIVEFTGVR